MSESILDHCLWRRAGFLTERIAELRQAPTTSQSPIEAALAAETLALWRANSPFDKDSYFADRLAMDGIGEAEFTRILGMPVEAFGANGTRPSWVEVLAHSYAPLDKKSDGKLENWGNIRNVPTAGFLNLVEPLMTDARRRLEARVEEIRRDFPEAPIEPAQTANAFFENLAWQLLAIVGRTMVLELNAARLEGKLQGATSKERFTDFTERLKHPDFALRLLAEYPVLARRIVSCRERWLNFSAEFLQHLAADWKNLIAFFGIDSGCGCLVEAAAGAGDMHRGGRSVVLAQFESGLKLVYKPRSMAADTHFQEFIGWLNERGADPQLRTLKVLDRGSHGWTEFVHAAGCSSEEEVVRFYKRQGEFLAIFYILEATDFHFENLLACGEHPVPVDLEALFHPWIRSIDIKQPDIRMVSLAKARSVLRIGLLPRRAWAHDDYSGMDLSGFGGAPGQLSDPVLQWAGAGTDEMVAVKEPLRMPGGRNRPSIDGSDVEVQQYKEPIISGFSRMYELLRSHRDELLSGDGPLRRFAQDSVRVVVRATRGYAVLLSHSLHPDYLRDGLELDRLLDRLWVGVEDNPHLLRLIQAERRDLLEGDIPIFTSRPVSGDLCTSTGDKIDGFFEKTGLALATEKVDALSAEDCRRQVWFIGASIATLDLHADEMKWTRYEPLKPAADCSLSKLAPHLIEEARRIGDHLVDLSLRDEKHAAWIGFAYVHKAWSLDALLEDLYGGSAGVILTLAYLGSFGFDKYTELARRALTTLRIRLEERAQYIHAIGAFNGWGGIIYALSHLAVLWQDQELLDYADDLLSRLPGLIEKDESLDLVGGCAGCIGGLLALHHVSASEKALAAAVQCGNRLVDAATPVKGGVGWLTNLKTVNPITGFAHGAAGYAWALLELAAQTGNNKYSDIALQAILYEHTQYVPEIENWTDNAGGHEPGVPKAAGPSMAWCYGAPGIGMARVSAMKRLTHPAVREDLDLAIQATIQHGIGTNHSLCHGDLGNLDFLLQACRATGSRELQAKVDELADQTFSSMKKSGWLCGMPIGVESPALMNGLAGICYGLLRLAAPDRVPSILTLAPALT
jgi:type 2 lantibiotic biosynthesis protein LanM